MIGIKVTPVYIVLYLLLRLVKFALAIGAIAFVIALALNTNP